jgi:hypothetical protein
MGGIGDGINWHFSIFMEYGMSAETIAVIIGIFILIMVIGTGLYIIRTVLMVAYILYMLLTFPIRMIWRIF